MSANERHRVVQRHAGRNNSHLRNGQGTARRSKCLPAPRLQLFAWRSAADVSLRQAHDERVREAGQAVNHAANASVRTRRATLRADAGNQANSRHAPSWDRAERARTPRRRATFARAPMGRQRLCETVAPSESSG